MAWKAHQALLELDSPMQGSVQGSVQGGRQALRTLCASKVHLTCSWRHPWLPMMQILQLVVQC